MNLLELNDDELRIFLEDGLPIDFLRNLYINNSKLAQKLKGFRPNKAPQKVLVNTSYSLIKSQKDVNLISLINRYYDGYKDCIEEKTDSLISKGYSESMAYAIAFDESTNDEFKPIYYKLEHFDEEKQKEIATNIALLKTIKLISSEEANYVIEDYKKNLNLDLEVYKKENKKELLFIKKEIERINNAEIIQDKEIKILSSNADFLSQKAEIKKVIDDKLNDTMKKIDMRIDEKFLGLAQNETLLTMQNQINSLKKELENLKSVKKNFEFNINKVENNEYEEFDDYLLENIGDVIEKIANGNKFDVLREYLIEVIYSNKPIIVSEKNSVFFAELLSSIITGGNYYTVDLNESYNENRLIEILNSLEFKNENKVILIRNKINVSDYSILLSYLKNRPFNEKFIFEITYEREIQFMPPEILDEFNFFIGEFDSRSIGYKYLYSFVKDSRKPVTNDSYGKTIDLLGIDISDKKVMNLKYYGLLSFSHIPFKAIHDNENKAELVNKIIDQSIRSKCEVIIDDYCL